MISSRRHLALSIVLCFAFAPALNAQRVTGRVLDSRTEEGVAGARVVLVDAEGNDRGSVESDGTGAFRLPVPFPGVFTLQVTRLGYQETTSQPFEVAFTETVEVELRLGIEAIVLEPLEVVGRSVNQRAWYLRDYYRRVDEYGKAGWGHFITRDVIDRRGAATAEQLVAGVPGVHLIPAGRTEYRVLMRSTRGYCTPTLYLNGGRVEGPLSDIITPSNLEGVEIYTRRSQVPMELTRTFNECGAIVMWTRPDATRPMTFKRFLAVLGIATFVLFVPSSLIM